MQSPKQRFQSRKEIAAEHSRRVIDPNFVATVDFALLQFIHDQASIKDPNMALATGHRLEGARDLVRILMNLAEPPSRGEPLPDGNLRGNLPPK